MRILIDYRPALRQPTGVGLWVAKLVEALAARPDTDTQIAVFSSSWKDRLLTVPEGVDRVDRRVPGRLLNWLWHRREWPPVEALAPGPIDVVHSASPLLIPSSQAARLVTIHDVDFLSHPERGEREIRSDYPRLARAHARRADGIVVSTAHISEVVARRFAVAPDRITVCPIGAPDWPARRQPPTAGHLLFVGTITPRKNIDRLLDAYTLLRQRHPDTPPLVLAGQPGVDAHHTLARIARPPLAGQVRPLGYVDTPRLRELYDQSVLLVLPSLDEGFGVPALEAMTVGVPVVAARRGALPEVVGDAGLLVDPLDIGALTDALERLLLDAPLRDRLSAAGRARARRFSWRASADALTGAYERAIARRAARPPMTTHAHRH